MNGNILNKCYLCKSDTVDFLQFSCNHNLCFSCFPYYFLHILKTSGINPEFFQNTEILYNCMICNKGTIKFPFEKLSSFQFPNTCQEDHVSTKKCEFCDLKLNSKSCLECKQDFCVDCFDSHHKPNKKFLTHKIISSEEKFQQTKLLCYCKSHEIMDKFCIDCQTGICKICVNQHKNHKNMPLNDIWDKMNNININNQRIIAMFLYELSNLQDTIKKMEDLSNIQNKEYDDNIGEIIELLKEMNKNNNEKAKQRIKLMKNMKDLIENSMDYLSRELVKKEELSSNKLFQFDGFFETKFIQNNPFNMSLDFDLNPIPNDFLKALKNTIIENKKDINSIEFFGKGSFSIKHELNNIIINNSRYDKFLSDPVALLSKEPFQLKTKAFCNVYKRCNVSTSFVINDETFIAWSSLKNEEFFPINIYNLSLDKIEKCIKNNSNITVLSVFPKDADYNKKSWLYSGDEDGFIRIFNISSKSFTEIHTIKTSVNHGILSAVIFEDKFSEIRLNNGESENVYIVVSFMNSAFPLRIYDLKGHVLEEIWNEFNKFCCSINYFHDEIISKTCVFLGFSNSWVELLDIKLKAYRKKFKSKLDVHSINFLFKKNKVNGNNEQLLIFTDNENCVNFYDIETEKNIAKVNFPGIINDICIWNNDFMITATSGDKEDNNALKVISLENLNVVIIIQFEDASPINLLKAIIIDKMKNQGCEGLVSFQNEGFPLLLYK